MKNKKYHLTHDIYEISLNFNNINKLPRELLKLFLIYQKDIIQRLINKPSFLVISESYDEYKAVQKIFETPKTDKTFYETLFNYINNSKFTEIELYKKADISRKLFSKIKADPNYHPAFGTITAFALALELSTKEYETFLRSASYSLPLNSYINITLKYCFDNEIYDLNSVNELLYNVAYKTVKEL